MKYQILTIVLAIAVTVSQPEAMADVHGWEPLDAITDIVAWFRNLNEEFDAVVEQEKRAQLQRAVDQLRKRLYELELDTQLLLDSIPTSRPTETQRDKIVHNIHKLLQTVNDLGSDLRQFGSELRLEDSMNGYEIERRLTYGLKTRALVLTDTEERLYESENPEIPWQSDAVRERLKTGLDAVRDAQLAATEFQNKLKTKGKED